MPAGQTASTFILDLPGLGFTSIVASLFTGTAGELRINTGTNTFVFGDIDGGKAAGFQIKVTGLRGVDAGDFML